MTRLEIGQVLERRYRVDSPIAQGGMSTVYRCVDLRLGRAVAAKVMAQRYVGDPVFVQRFEREARAMARLQHPNLVAVHDFSADGELIYLIMELIDGGTLRELLAERGPLPAHAALSIMRSVLSGLAEVHRTGLVHRDIKPDNVLITASSQVKVGDFGLVRSSSAQPTSNNIVGTVSYLAPEQVTGEDITPAADVYSAGIVLFELLTGTVPFHGDSALAHAMARLDRDVPTASSRIDGVHSLVDELVATATARNPEDRFADAAEFVEAVEDVARELGFGHYVVPVPRNAAAARTAARPTDFTGTDSRDVFAPTTTIPATQPQRTPPAQPAPSTPRPAPYPPASTRRYPVVAPTPVNPAPAAPVPAPAPALPMQEPQPKQSRSVSNRSPFKLAIFLVVAVLSTLAVAVGAWWFGSTNYGGVPILWR